MMISYGKQDIDENDIKAVNKVLRSSWLTQGPTIESFENKLKSYFSVKYCSAVSNGTAALHLTGIALGWSKGDIVLTSPITFLASANSIIYCGATPDFVDIDEQDYTLNPNFLENKIKLYLKKGMSIKSVIGVDYAGMPCDWEALRFLADKYDFTLVNDNCHAMGSEYKRKKHYAAKYADVVTQSFHPVKHITTGEGGAVLTNNILLAEKIKSLRTHGMTKSPQLLTKNDGPWYYEMHNIGYNYRMTDFQAALGISQLGKLDSFVSRRRNIASHYDYSFKSNSYLQIPNKKSSMKHSYHLYPLLFDFGRMKTDKKMFFDEMKSNNILLQVHYVPVHLQPYYTQKFGFKIGDFPNSEKFYEKEFSIPMYPKLRQDEIDHVVETINRLLCISQ